MGIIESIQSGISRAIWKGVKHAGTAIAGVAASFIPKYLGIELPPEWQLAIATFVTGALGAGLKLAKDKFPKQLGWL
jgi:hypothetical protein